MSATTTAAAASASAPSTGTLHKKTESLHFVEKYRPADLDELIGQNEIVSTLTRLVAGGDLPHLLFYGPPGTGKTSTILAIAKQIYGAQWKKMILELNASDDRGIDVVREQIKSFAGTKQLFSSGTKLIILDEADSMTLPAQAALRRVIEKYTKNARFCLICNYLSKIIPAIQSRCTRFRFHPLRKDAVLGRLRDIAKQEQLNVTEDGFEALIALGHGDMRRSVNVLQSTSMASDVIDETTVYLSTGNPLPAVIEEILSTLLNAPFNEALDFVRAKMLEGGLALQDIVSAVHAWLLKLEMPRDVRIALYIALADLEQRLTVSTDESIQVMSFVGMFQQLRVSLSEIQE